MDMYIIIFVSIVVIGIITAFMIKRTNDKIENDKLFSPKNDIKIKIERPLPKNYFKYLRAARGKKKAKTVFKHDLHKVHFGNFSVIKPLR